ncbi:DUF488 family protein [Paenibacillus sp.]|uniref:DUF488 domain-containing protein n=1 Tax=Paenibacillus sp. TaxID=58172 RepID=UPI002810F0A6|nr:DUF488 family protein [Paenibacillus sp.]
MENVAIAVKRIYDPAEAADGRRILVDRLWPRGVSKDRAQLTLWMKEVAPSAGLREWYHRQPQDMAERFETFKARYEAELADDSLRGSLERLRTWAEEGKVTLLYAANTGEWNHARVLKEFLDKL